MKNKLTRLALIGASCGLVLMASARALQEGGTQEASAAMEAMMKYAQPGPMHEKLSPMIGEWNVTVQYRMAAEAPWEEMKAAASREWILGGRYLQDTVTGDWMGMPFEGIGLIGYDNMREEYNTVWMDNSSTSLLYGRGATLTTITGEVADPMTGDKNKWFRSAWKIEGKDKNIYESFAKDEAGKEFSAMKITYTRQ